MLIGVMADSAPPQIIAAASPLLDYLEGIADGVIPDGARGTPARHQSCPRRLDRVGERRDQTKPRDDDPTFHQLMLHAPHASICPILDAVPIRY
jgi:hypothetical protein